MTGLWRVRRSTVDLLDHFASSNELPPDGAETVRRASRLLAAYLREIMGVEPSTMKLVFPDLAGGRV